MTKFHLRLAVVGLSMCFFLQGLRAPAGQSPRAQQREFQFRQNQKQNGKGI